MTEVHRQSLLSLPHPLSESKGPIAKEELRDQACLQMCLDYCMARPHAVALHSPLICPSFISLTPQPDLTTTGEEQVATEQLSLGECHRQQRQESEEPAGELSVRQMDSAASQ